jgi:hypothetical protein
MTRCEYCPQCGDNARCGHEWHQGDCAGCDAKDAEIANARRTSAYWKAEHLAANAVIDTECAKAQWQLIETAPKDGTAVVLYMGDWLEPCYLAGRWDGKSWLIGAHATVSGPTHYIQLPSPPALGLTGEEPR